jgi:hypothetical protein
MNEERAPAAGFLAHLVERVRPTEPLLQRRQPSLFEPVQPWTDARTRDGPGDGSDGVPRTMPDAPVSPAVTSPAAPIGMFAPPPAVPAPTSRQSTESADASAPAAMPTAATTVRQELRILRETLRVGPSLRVIHEVITPAPAAPVQIEPLTVAASAAPAFEAPRAPDTAPEKPRTAQPAPEPLVLASPRPLAPVAVLTPPPSHPARAEAMAVPVALRSHAPPPLAHAAQRAAAAQAALRQAQPPRELPPVQVTIGHVDVRAVAAPPAAERSRHNPPRLSLEQYLRERSEGNS